MNNWKFDQPPNVVALTTKQVIERTHPIKIVIHYAEDHSWAFLCGTTDQKIDRRIVSMEEIISIDPTVESVANLESGYSATRESKESNWIISKDSSA